MSKPGLGNPGFAVKESAQGDGGEADSALARKQEISFCSNRRGQRLLSHEVAIGLCLFAGHAAQRKAGCHHGDDQGGKQDMTITNLHDVVSLALNLSITMTPVSGTVQSTRRTLP